MKTTDRAFTRLQAEAHRRGAEVARDALRIERGILALCDLTPFAAAHGIDPEAIGDIVALVLVTAAELKPGPRPKGDA